MNDPYKTPEADSDPVEEPRSFSLNISHSKFARVSICTFVGLMIGLVAFSAIDAIVYYCFHIFEFGPLKYDNVWLRVSRPAFFVVVVTSVIGGAIFGYQTRLRFSQKTKFN